MDFSDAAPPPSPSKAAAEIEKPPIRSATPAEHSLAPPPTAVGPAPVSPSQSVHARPPRPLRPSQFPAAAPAPSSSSLQRGGVAMGVPAGLPHQRAPQQTSVPFSSFSQTYNGLPRAPTTGSSASAQSHSISAPNSSLRPGGMPGNLLQRPVQPSLRSVSPSSIQSNPSQRFPSGSFRGPSQSSPVSHLSSQQQSSQPHQQPWLTAQGRPPGAGSLASGPSYRPPNRPHLVQPRPPQLISGQHLQQNQKPPSQLLQQPSLPKVQQTVYQSQQARVQKTAGPPPAGAAQPGFFAQPPETDDVDEFCNQVISKRTIRDLVAQIDPSERLDPEVEDILVEVAEEFVESITTFGCSLAKHRKSATLEAKDILLHLERNWNMTIPGFGGDEIKCYKKPLTNEVHKERLSLVRKSMVAANEPRNSAAGPSSATHAKSHGPKPAPPLLSSPGLS